MAWSTQIQTRHYCNFACVKWCFRNFFLLRALQNLTFSDDIQTFSYAINQYNRACKHWTIMIIVASPNHWFLVGRLDAEIKIVPWRCFTNSLMGMGGIGVGEEACLHILLWGHISALLTIVIHEWPPLAGAGEYVLSYQHQRQRGRPDIWQCLVISATGASVYEGSENLGK